MVMNNRMVMGRILLGGILLLLLAMIPACKKEEPQADQASDSNPQAAAGDQEADSIEPSDAKIALKVLYVGMPNTDRQQDFVSFLSRHFQTVTTADLYAFKEEDASQSDVVLLDKDGIQWGDDGGRPLSDLRLSRNYTRPTVSLGIPGAFLTDRMGLKTGYM